MAGLMTVEGLLRVLVNEILDRAFPAYNEIVREKAKVTKDLKKNPSNSQTDYLLGLLAKQEEFVSNYVVVKCSRIERIISILEKNEKKLSATKNDDYKHVSEFLRELIQKKGGLPILEEQKHALTSGDARKYLSLYKKESRLLSNALKPFNKIDFKKSKRYAKIPLKKRLKSLTLGLALLAAAVTAAACITFTSQEDYNPKFDCEFFGERGIVVDFKDERGLEQITHVLENYVKKDLHYQTHAEENFEAVTGTELLGDFSIEHIEWMEEFMERTYGLHNFHNYFGTKRLIVFPQSAKLIFKSQECSHKQSARHRNVGGYADWSGDIVIKAPNPLDLQTYKEKEQKDLFIRILAHELAHHYHFENSKKSLRNNSEPSIVFTGKGRFQLDYRNPQSIRQLTTEEINASSIYQTPAFPLPRETEKTIKNIIERHRDHFREDPETVFENMKLGKEKSPSIIMASFRETRSFDDDWKSIGKGGYARGYGKTDIWEDVATTVEMVMQAYLNGTPISDLRPMNNNPENLLKFRLKIIKLKQYGFLPPSVKLDFDQKDMAKLIQDAKIQRDQDRMPPQWKGAKNSPKDAFARRTRRA